MQTKNLGERKRLLLSFMGDAMYVPMKIKEIQLILGIDDKDRPYLEQALTELLADGSIEISKRGKYFLKGSEYEQKVAVQSEPRVSQKKGTLPKVRRDGAKSMSDTGEEKVRKNDHGTDEETIINAIGLPTDFPADVRAEAMAMPKKVLKKAAKGRVDFRDQLIVTIDGADTRDIDDAVGLEVTENGYRLGVHIADVTEYVTEGSALDSEALKRGTSVYFPDKVLPMLPRELSNGICSLNENEDRLTLSCIMELDKSGAITDYEICEGIIKSRHKMTYDDVQAILDDRDCDAARRYSECVELFYLMEKVSRLLRDRRHTRGGIDFDVEESHIIAGADGTIEVESADRSYSHKIIEDFMLAANETVAQCFCKQKIPFLYRIHEKPDADKMQDLNETLKSFSLHVKCDGADVSPKAVQHVLEKVQGTDDEAFISTVVLRSMQQARYSVENLGHFGIAAEYYSHFTSPIRRYPDLQIHRIIKEQLRGLGTPKRIRHYASILPVVADSTSKLERRADEAEREVEKLYKAMYMEQHIGEVFEGRISGVTGWGLYVKLPNTIEGLVPVRMLDDYYNFDERRLTLTGKKNKHVYRIGDAVTVQVTSVDRVLKNIDFRIYTGEDRVTRHGKRTRKTHRK